MPRRNVTGRLATAQAAARITDAGPGARPQAAHASLGAGVHVTEHRRPGHYLRAGGQDLRGLLACVSRPGSQVCAAPDQSLPFWWLHHSPFGWHGSLPGREPDIPVAASDLTCR